LSEQEVQTLRSFEDDRDHLDFLQSEIETKYFNEHKDRIAESDKAWDAMHRALGDGDLSWTTGPYPLRLAVIGGELIYAGDDYIMSLKTPAEVKDVAKAVVTITEDEFRQKYDAVDPDRYGFQKSEDDFGYTWDWFAGVVAFYQQAAAEDRWVLFTADQ
jgi:hypothetical protein